MACRGESLAVVRFLLDQGINIQLQNTFWETALTHAAKYGCLDIVKLLIKYGKSTRSGQINGTFISNIPYVDAKMYF